jgi:hypothetical protein
MAAAHRTLKPILWDVRSHLEAQLRCLSKVQLLLDELELQPPGQRAVDVASIVENVEELCEIHATLKPICADALLISARLKLAPD